MSKNQRKAWRKMMVLIVQHGSGVISDNKFTSKLRPMLKAYQEKWHPDLSFT